MQYGLHSRAVDDACHEVTLRGRVYAAASQELRAALDAASARARWVLIDARELESIDAVALHGVVVAVRRLRERGGGIRFFGVGENVRRFFELTGVDRVVSIFASRDDALRENA